MGKDIVLITGAGSSYDLCSGIGLGNQLMIDVRDMTNDPKFHNYCLNTLELSRKDIDQFSYYYDMYFSWRKKTIDEFLTEISIYPEYYENRGKLLLIGKTAVLFNILKYESNFLWDFRESYHLTSSWMEQICKYINSVGILDFYSNFESPTDRSFQIITFNYDRVFEYCFNLLFPDRERSVVNFLENNVFHVYGYVPISEISFGKVDFYELDSRKYVDYFETLYDNRIHEQTRNVVKSNSKKIDNCSCSTAILNSSSIYVMGFGFDYLNCRNINILSLDKEINISLIVNGRQFDFNERREKTDEIRKMIRKANFYFNDLNSFVQHRVLS